MRVKEFFPENPEGFRKKALIWASKKRVAAFFTGNNYNLSFGTFPDVLAVDPISEICSETGSAFDALKEYLKDKTGFIPGFLSYDLKNELEEVSTKSSKTFHYPDLFFFQPSKIITFCSGRIQIESFDPDTVFNEINSKKEDVVTKKNFSIFPNPNINREEYLDKVQKIRDHIIEGDIYEANFCMEFVAENAEVDPLHLFSEITLSTPMPFSCFFKLDDLFICCGSPERFLKKEGKKLLSQPMKGTVKRGANDAEDAENKKYLSENEKERAENMMIVDLVRNDLSRSCLPGTVKVAELFGIYSFPHVFQMISSISGTTKSNLTPLDCIKNAFPMGSMTGAPKIRAMELIDEYENSRRGIFSGACGFFTGDGDFDFNVVIRTVIVDQKSKKVSCHFGSAITIDSDPESEYKECMLKAERIMKIFRNS